MNKSNGEGRNGKEELKKQKLLKWEKRKKKAKNPPKHIFSG